MKTINLFGKEVCSCVIIRIVLSTLAIIALFYLTSCVTPSSVRGNKSISIDEDNSEKESRKDKRKRIESERDAEFAKLLEEAENQKTNKKSFFHSFLFSCLFKDINETFKVPENKVIYYNTYIRIIHFKPFKCP